MLKISLIQSSKQVFVQVNRTVTVVLEKERWVFFSVGVSIKNIANDLYKAVNPCSLAISYVWNL